MIPMLRTEPREIGGKTYQIRVLPFAEAMQLFPKVQLLVAFSKASDVKDQSPVMLALAGGQLKPELLQEMIKAFGAHTTVDFGDGRVLKLVKVPASKNGPEVDPFTELFSGSFEHLVEWLDACLDMNFGSSAAKLTGALEAMLQTAPKAQPTPDQE